MNCEENTTGCGNDENSVVEKKKSAPIGYKSFPMTGRSIKRVFVSRKNKEILFFFF